MPGIARLALPGIVLVLASLLPFLNKAYTIDDPWFLYEARQILRTPLQPMSFAICWNGNEECVTSAANWGPGSTQGLMGYLLAPVVMAGGAEWMAHLLQALLACLSVFEMVRLALRLGFDRVQAAASGLMLAAIPPFLSMASTAMPDNVALTLGLLGIERLLAWKDERGWQQAAVAALALGLAPYARPNLVLLLPLGALWLLNELHLRAAVRQFRREAYLWSPLVLAAGILLTVNLLTRESGPHATPTNLLVGSSRVLANLYAYGVYLSFPIPFVAVWLAIYWRRTPLLVLLPVIPILLLQFTASKPLEWPSTVAAVYGLATLVYMVWRYLWTWDRVGILLSLWTLISLPIVIYIHMPMKYMLPGLPAVVLILLRLLSTLPRQRELLAYAAIVLGCATLSAVLLIADNDLAEYGRRAVAELVVPHVARGEKVWFGGQWGFYWYAEKAGATLSKPGQPGPNPGELLVVGLRESGDVTRARFSHRRLVDSRHYNAPHGRTMGDGAGLYSNGYGSGYWPWVWKPETTNDYELWQID